MARRGFTLVELMLAVSILSIGIVSILRSFLSAASAFDSASNSIKALQELQAGMADWEEKAIQEGGVTPGRTEDKLRLDSRDAFRKTEIVSLEMEELENLTEIKITLSWHENNKENNRSLATYLKRKDETTGN